ncbi:MAG: hypothetical protein AABW89_01655 [Nanoarchaeota archaeon]
MEFLKYFIIVATVLSLFASVMFSLRSFTGYLVSDIVNGDSNLASFLFLILGISGTLIYLSKYRKPYKKAQSSL